MNILNFLKEEWVPALGCTEPASIAYAGSIAADQLGGAPKKAVVTVDPRIYKNCYAVGIPHSSHMTGIKWAAAIGIFLKGSMSKLECFKDIDDAVLKKAGKFIASNGLTIKIDRTKKELYIDFTISDGKNTGRCIIEKKHTNVTFVFKNGKKIQHVAIKKIGRAGGKSGTSARKWAAEQTTKEILKIAARLNSESRALIRKGAKMNIAICKHGLKLFPAHFVKMTGLDPLTKISSFVCAGVYARMWGEDFPVMSVAGSGNKGITCTVPLILLQKEWKFSDKKLEEALAISMLFTSKTTEYLGTLSAVCGCSNAAGIGLACAIIYLKGGGEKEISFAINNMVGNVTGMICDGAKIGCALKTMTAVDAAFRASSLAMNGIAIPFEDGIVGKNGNDSLKNMSKIAKLGMIRTDEEILKIMEEKLRT